MNRVILKPGREKSLLRRHPWVFSGALARVEGDPQNGATVAIVSSSGQFLGWGAYSGNSQIRIRVWSWDEGDTIDREFLSRRLHQAFQLRKMLALGGDGQACRLVHAESDGLPGLVVDQYSNTLVVQFLSAGSEFWRQDLVNLLLTHTGASRIYERSDVDVRSLEGLDIRSGLLRGDELPGCIQFIENKLNFWVDVGQGQKTGFYLDQRENRRIVGDLCAGRQVLDCFCFSGGFSTYALAHGALDVLAIDASTEALALRQANLQLNGIDLGRSHEIQGDAFQVLRTLRDSRRSFDLIILDPPKFAQSESQVERAARGYKDINLLAFKLLRPGGILATFSCSGGVSRELFQKIVAGAALDAGVEAQIIQQLSQAPDHPIALNFPEGAYLKGLLLRVP